MKLKLLAWTCLFGMLRMMAAPSPYVITDGPVVLPPQINSLVWTNLGTMTLANFVPYETQNTVRYVNLGELDAFPGFRFETVDDAGFRRAANEFINRGIIRSEELELSFNLSFLDAGDNTHPVYGGLINIWATNIFNRGPILGAYGGEVRIRGENVDLSRSGIGNTALSYSSWENFGLFGAGFGGRFTTPLLSQIAVATDQYFAEIGVEDVWWHYADMRVSYYNPEEFEVGVEETAFGPTPAVTMGTNPFNITTEFMAAGDELRTSLGGGFFGGNFRVFCLTNQVNPTNKLVEIAFVRVPDTNVWVDVSWSFGPNAPDNPQRIAFVRMSTFGTNSLTLESETNSLVIVDSFAADPSTVLLNNIEFERRFQPTNIFMVRSFNADVTRPIGRFTTNADFYPEIFLQWIDDDNGAPSPGITMTNGTLVGATTNGYATWAGRVDSLPSRVPVFDDLAANNFGIFGIGGFFGPPSAALPQASFTNFAGRVAISAKNLNLNRTRLQARGVLTVQTDNLVDARNVSLEAPIISLDLNATNELVIENMIKGSAARLGGEVAVLSLSFSNFFTATNASAGGGTGVDTDGDGVNDMCDIDGDGVGDIPGDCPTDTGGTDTNFNVFYHVTVVDTTLQGIQNQFVSSLILRSKESRLVDDTSVQATLLVESEKVTLDGTLTGGGFLDFGRTNFPNVQDLTLSPGGSMQFFGLINLGSDRDSGIGKIANSGAIFGSSINVKADQLVSDGSVNAFDGQLTLNSGSFVGSQNSRLDARFQTRLQGGDVQLGGEISAGGYVFIDAAERLVDGGVGNGAVITTGLGTWISSKPGSSDLSNSTIRTVVPSLAEAEHVWAGDDLGASPVGFENNLAIGVLSLDVGNLSTATFRGIGEKNALYCRLLDLSDAMVATIEDSLNVEPNLTIYFAGTSENINPAVLDGFVTLGGGRLVYVPLEASEAPVVAKVELSEDRSSVRVVWNGRPFKRYEVQSIDLATGGWKTIRALSNDSVESHLLQVEERVSGGTGVLYRVLMVD